MIEKQLAKFLTQVEKPARYIGGETGAVIKQTNEVDIRFAFCFPDTYEIGMSHLGMKILYYLLNNEPDIWCERVFAPWPDMEDKLRENHIPLYGLESKDPIGNFDFIGFTLLYEMCYTNVVNMLELAGVPLFSRDRREGMPFVIAGGPCTVNPEPLADFIDFFLIGEGEEVLLEVMDAYRLYRKEGGLRIDFLRRVSQIEGVYVPQFYEPEYLDDGRIKAYRKLEPCAPDRVKKRIVKDFDHVFFPKQAVVPFINIVHDRIMLEVQRGCIRGCRFCQAGMIYRPVRQKSPETLAEETRRLFENTGYEEISLCSLSTSDYDDLPCLCGNLKNYADAHRINLALPSLRLDSVSFDLLKSIGNQRKSSLTFAPEAATQRLRDVINKNITEQDIENGARIAFSEGYGSLKLYFMIGLPTETQEDVLSIRNLAYQILDVYYDTPKEVRSARIGLTVSTSSFVPKPFTPFQWCAQDPMDVLEGKQKLLKAEIKRRQVSYNWHDAKISFLEAVFSRGDRRLSSVIASAHRRGCKFDSWNEYFKFASYLEAFDENGLDPAFYANRERDLNEVLPWDIIDVGVSKEFLQREYRRAMEGKTTKNCAQACSLCGVMDYEAGICVEGRCGHE